MLSVCCGLLQEHLPPVVTMATKGQRPVHRADQLEYVTCVPTAVFRYKCSINVNIEAHSQSRSTGTCCVFLLLCFCMNACRLSILAMNVLYHMLRGRAYAAEKMKQLASERCVNDFQWVSSTFSVG